MKPTQVFHPYQLHRDQLSIVRKYDLVCVGGPHDGQQLAPFSGFRTAFALPSKRSKRFEYPLPCLLFGSLEDVIYFVPRAEAEGIGLEWKQVFPRAGKPTMADRISTLEEENKTLRETLAKIAALAGESK